MSRRGGAIYHRKDGLWEARYVKEIDLAGKKHYGSVYGHSYREAKEKRQQVMDHILLYQKPVSSRRMTVAELADEWLWINHSRLKQSTLERYRGFVKNHIKPALGFAGVMYLTTTTIHQFALGRLEAGLAPQSVNTILIILHSILKYGSRQYHFPLPEIV